MREIREAELREQAISRANQAFTRLTELNRNGRRDPSSRLSPEQVRNGLQLLYARFVSRWTVITP